ncbi:MAG: hypothetical protein HOQ07_03415, partial [Sinomonas sp.]|nr:hypothetical protein [Sinomonas sp.]
ENADDALALLLTQGIPAAHPRPADAPAERSSRGEEQDGERRPRRLEPVRDGITSLFPRLAPNHEGEQGPEDAHLRLAPGLSSATREITIVPGPASKEPEGRQDGDAPQATADPAGNPETPARGPHHDPEPGPEPAEPNETKTPAHAPTVAPREAPASNHTEAPGQKPAPSAGRGRDEPTPEPARRASRPKRSSIPSWDEIVFGTKSD